MSQNRMKTLGQIGYEAYAVATGGKTWDGRDMPTWEQVLASGTKVAAAWEFAAQGIVCEFTLRLRMPLEKADDKSSPVLMPAAEIEKTYEPVREDQATKTEGPEA